MRWANKDGFQELCFYCRTAKSRVPALAVLPYKEAAKLATEVGETHDLWRKERDACIERERVKFDTRGGTVDLREIGKCFRFFRSISASRGAGILSYMAS